MSFDLRRLAFGFLAGALAVLVFHQGAVFVLNLMKLTPNAPWNMGGAIGPLKLPTLINQMFWGGLWGIAFGAFAHLIPVAHNILRGAIFGLLGPFILGGGVLVPLFKQVASSPYFWAWPSLRWIVGGIIGASFGIGVAVFMRMIAKR